MTASAPSWNNDPLAATLPVEASAAELVANHRLSRDTAYEAFFRYTYADTVRSLVRTGLDAESAADCAQEAYVRAYARWWRIRRYDDPAAWVRRVATNLAIDLHRKRDRQQRALPRLAPGGNGSTPAPAEPETFTELSAGLPDQQRRVIELCYGEDLTAEQAAERLGISAGAVRFHLSRARQRLRPEIDLRREQEEMS